MKPGKVLSGLKFLHELSAWKLNQSSIGRKDYNHLLMQERVLYHAIGLIEENKKLRAKIELWRTNIGYDFVEETDEPPRNQASEVPQETP